MKLKKLLMIFTLIFCLPASAVKADTLWQTSVSSADLIDQRTFAAPDYGPSSSEGGLEGYWPDSFVIGWDIAYDTETALWSYAYSLSSDGKDIAHFILEISNPSSAEGPFYDVMINGIPSETEGPAMWGADQGNSNPGIPADFYGIKFDVGGSLVTYSFKSELDPVWGNFYAKSGKDKGNQVLAYNNALGYDGFESTNKLDFVPRPDGGTPPVVPEPVSYVLFIAGGAMIAGISYRRRTRNS